jgi:CubicO group peptidase (beta-lactamase class C family)
VAAQILRPLGMTATTLEAREVPKGRLALGYRWEDEQWKEEAQLPDGAFGAMGGMLTSLSDLSRYVGMQMSAWPPRDGPETAPIRRASLREMQQVARPAPSSVTRDASGAVQLNTGGYGYGLRVAESCSFGHIVSHSGGLPGFGSQMRWLPDHGVGVVALGNRTYTGWNGPITSAFELLQKTGALERRRPEPSDALVNARDQVSQLIIRWDDELADRIAAVNLYRDRSKERRRREIEDLRATVGACAAPAAFDIVENALRGQWTMSCERGKLGVSITLAPTMPPRVQFLAVGTALPAVRPTCTP